MSLHEVPVEPIAYSQRSLDVNLVAGFEQSKVRFIQCLLNHVKSDFPGGALGDRQTNAVDRNALAIGEIVPMSGKREPAKHRPIRDADHANRSLDDPGEHWPIVGSGIMIEQNK